MHCPSPPDQPLLLSVTAAAPMLAVSTRYLRVLISSGALPVVRLGRRTLVRRADLLAIVSSGGLAAVGRPPETA
ncbi:MAG: helix-turn-helix domain-containing protein [Polyangia bacterium]